ncbi:MAG: DEAD/DEAH box helicase [Alphaproteobacteria bacterium BRH_c36]|nr:MAG: DEAD/DEAH box helicase [Alphaproteobacteria bacterium BRH_c36]
MTDFEGVVPALRDALTKREYVELTPVQKAVLAPDVTGQDAVVSAQTGSGKTVAFGLAIAPDLLQGGDRFAAATAPLALIVAPTRELALQIKREFDWLYAETGAEIASCVGGMDMRNERRALGRGAHIVVGTPGRLRDHIERGSFVTTGLKAVVLDEADEMLDLGFREDLEFILGATPQERRTMLFSATVPRTIANLAKQYQRDAVRISTKEETRQHVDIEYRALTVAANESENAIHNVLRYYEAKNALVFCTTRVTVNHMMSRFRNRGFSVVALSGELSQSERTHALQSMRDGRARVCIATDVAARGIDLPNLELVIHADLPTNAETLLHRSGRTGRAGRKGVSVLIVPRNKRRVAERLLRNAQIYASWGVPPSIEDITKRDNERLLAHPSLAAPLEEKELPLINDLLARHGPEVIAAAFIRAIRVDQSAPEELQETAEPEPARFERGDRPDRASTARTGAPNRDEPPRPNKRKDDFAESVWFSISVGRKQNAEPAWLLPLLCNGGDLTKQDIGAIKIQPEETFVQLSAECVDRFLAAIGPNNTLQKTIRVKRLDTPPQFGGIAGTSRPSTGKPSFEGKKPKFGAKKWNGRSDSGSRGAESGPHDNAPLATTKPQGEKRFEGKRQPKFKSDKTGSGKPTFGPRTGKPKHKKSKTSKAEQSP